VKLCAAFSRLWRSERGAVATELVLVLPILIMLTIGVINASFMLFTTATIHFATQDAARWCMINASTCTSNTVNTYATARYPGLATANFIVDTAQCAGAQVSGTATYTFVTGLASISVPLSATACRPQD
jgi:Flp pilus assembly protein TadG